jgi:hypothetical protein
MTQEETITYWEIYQKLVDLEKGIQELKALLQASRFSEEIVCCHPVSLKGIWAGADITDEDIEAARRSMFPYEDHD